MSSSCSKTIIEYMIKKTLITEPYYAACSVHYAYCHINYAHGDRLD